MNNILIGISTTLLIGLLLFLGLILNTLFGAMAGAVVGWLFDETSLKVLTYFGINNFAMWEIGAALGFFGSAFKSSNTNNCNK